MKASRLYLVGVLVLAVALAWTSVTPQVVDASEVTITGACGGPPPPAPCTTEEMHQCSYMNPEGGCCPNWQEFCMGNGSGECYLWDYTFCEMDGNCSTMYVAKGCYGN